MQNTRRRRLPLLSVTLGLGFNGKKGWLHAWIFDEDCVSNQEFGFWKLRRFYRFPTWKKAWVRCRFVHDTSTASRDPKSRELESSMKQQMWNRSKSFQIVSVCFGTLSKVRGWSLERSQRLGMWMESGLWRESVTCDRETYEHNFWQEVRRNSKMRISLWWRWWSWVGPLGRSVLSFPAPRSSHYVPSSALCYL
jgi:hypothetical protein